MSGKSNVRSSDFQHDFPQYTSSSNFLAISRQWLGKAKRWNARPSRAESADKAAGDNQNCKPKFDRRPQVERQGK